MDKGRHPQVIRTWIVERTKAFSKPPQALKPTRDIRRGSQRRLPPAPPGPKSRPDNGPADRSGLG
jgi:hypothetical protein